MMASVAPRDSIITVSLGISLRISYELIMMTYIRGLPLHGENVCSNTYRRGTGDRNR